MVRVNAIKQKLADLNRTRNDGLLFGMTTEALESEIKRTSDDLDLVRNELKKLTGEYLQESPGAERPAGTITPPRGGGRGRGSRYVAPRVSAQQLNDLLK